jgi:nicotinamidase/pyrazinamidase
MGGVTAGVESAPVPHAGHGAPALTPRVVRPSDNAGAVIDPADTALIAVDVQRDFLPGGALGVTGGDAVVAPIRELAAHAGLVVATRDFHPPGHCSFAAQGGPWPPHCVIGTSGAALHPDIDAIAQLIVSKGTDPAVEQYSGFDGTGLGDLLRARGVRRVVIGGLATDYCVRATALAACGERFATTVVRDAVRAVDRQPGDGERALNEIRAAGGHVSTRAEILGAMPVPRRRQGALVRRPQR